MPPDRISVFPGKAKLEIMAGNPLVDSEGPRIQRCRVPEVAKFFRRLRHVTDAILI